mgnify:CR=1 FL=1
MIDKPSGFANFTLPTVVSVQSRDRFLEIKAMPCLTAQQRYAYNRHPAYRRAGFRRSRKHSAGLRPGLEIMRQQYPPKYEHEAEGNAETIDNAERGGAVRVNAE